MDEALAALASDAQLGLSIGDWLCCAAVASSVSWLRELSKFIAWSSRKADAAKDTGFVSRYGENIDVPRCLVRLCGWSDCTMGLSGQRPGGRMAARPGAFWAGAILRRFYRRRQIRRRFFLCLLLGSESRDQIFFFSRRAQPAFCDSH